MKCKRADQDTEPKLKLGAKWGSEISETLERGRQQNNKRKDTNYCWSSRKGDTLGVGRRCSGLRVKRGIGRGYLPNNQGGSVGNSLVALGP